MKKVLFALYLFICYNSMADDNVEVKRQCIAISQTFIGQGECKPSFGSSDIYYFNKKNEEKLLLTTDCIVKDYPIAKCDQDDSFKMINNEMFSKIIVKSHINGIANDKNASFTYDLSEIKTGVNLKTESASDPCHNMFNDFFGGNRNSYTLMTYLIKDVYIDIEKLPEEMEEINVDKGEVLKLKFGKFYPNSKDNRKLQINVGNSGWVDLKLNAGKQITSEGEIEITFDEIVISVCGNGDSFDEKYVKCTAKTIDIRAVKKLLDGVQTHGQIVSCQFYQKGPEFEILKVRSPSCGGVSIKVKMKKEDFDNYSKNGFEWRIKRIDPKPNNFSAEFILNSGSAQYDENNGVIDLSDIKSKKKDGELQKTLMEFLESDNSNYPSTWEMQLAIINDGGEEASTEGRSFHVEKFTIPERLNPIKIDADPVINNNE